MSKSLCELHEVFVPFKTTKVESGSIIFFNEGLSCGFTRDDLILRYCYIVDPELSEKINSFSETDSEKFFLLKGTEAIEFLKMVAAVAVDSMGSSK
ncbi:hypothetical protein [Pseudomonas poae]|uniref:hypothetical protein n=1 Tax=Pseudomonas poae TaxID=200451 RepID=UPI0030DFDABC